MASAGGPTALKKDANDWIRSSGRLEIFIEIILKIKNGNHITKLDMAPVFCERNSMGLLQGRSNLFGPGCDPAVGQFRLVHLIQRQSQEVAFRIQRHGIRMQIAVGADSAVYSLPQVWACP